MHFISKKEILSRIDRYLEDPRLGPEALLRKRWAWIWMVVTCIGVILSTIIFIAIGFWQFWWHFPAFLAGYAVAFFLFPRVKRFDLVLNILFS